ncbi:hypothetical protein GCM10007094_10650 [Pseudovibrio japonicus]|uniref:Uncharacterized protein n=1 Tax=Pseudovibrio japonicus TaxID=366534 RepID=A0ABQ3E601_9HYPH|nr:hypothetical protein [Pseudovibrio japonicus]GHB24473.1 hypothetical protein GCM10007094_10650 [Pseudovibrio japonicus]
MTDDDEYSPPKMLTPYDLYAETGDGNPLAPPYQDEQLWKVVERHFPEITRKTLVYKQITAEAAVEATDNAIRDYCAWDASWDGRSFREDGQPLILYDHKHSGSALIKQAIQAIDDRDLKSWREAKALMPYSTRRLIMDTAARVGPNIRRLGDRAVLALGPSPSNLQAHSKDWHIERSILKAALKQSSKGGRPSYAYKDYAVRECVHLWETLSGKTAIQPALQAR